MDDDDDLTMGPIARESLRDGLEEGPREPTTWTRYDLGTYANGRIAGRATTNDGNDDGIPDADLRSWFVLYDDRAQMFKATGGTHQFNLRQVRVYLDGELVDIEGNSIAG